MNKQDNLMTDREKAGVEEEVVRAALVGGVGENTEELQEKSLCELERLLNTAGGVCIARVTQNRPHPDPRFYLGSGKIEEIAALAKANDISLVVVDDELSPSQIKNIEDAMESQVRVIDRTMLILDIFARNAVTSEGILQVEIAQLKYSLPRLLGKGSELSRLGGGIGTRGPGESKLETDRRHIKRRIAYLEAALREMDENRAVQRRARKSAGIPQIAVAGYTNVGKSTLLNKLTDAGILSENKLFATLDPTTRRLKLPNGKEVLLTDTVGFIQRLPHHLVEAFKSTLDEVVLADLILILLDAADPEVQSQLTVTEEILSSLFEKRRVEPKPVLYIFNQCDRVSGDLPAFTPRADTVYISALTGEGIDDLLSRVEKALDEGKKEVVFRFPASGGGYVSRLYQTSTVLSCDYTENGIVVRTIADEKIRGMYREYLQLEGGN